MDLWVRSQKKRSLIKVNNLVILDDNSITNLGSEYDLEFRITLGIYKTKERALEVLDEIQCKITQNECLKTMITKLNSIKGEEEKIGKLFKETIYEMPED